MAKKNPARREQILSAAYELFSRASYDQVSLSDIARDAGITKSLLQHYYTQKIDIIRTMLEVLLSVSFSYMEDRTSSEEDLFQGISDFNMLFFKGVDRDYKLRQFMYCSVRHPECLDAWVDTICSWLRHCCGEQTFTYRQLKTALCFAMGGSMHLFQHQDELDINYRRFCRNHVRTILELLDYDPEITARILKTTDERIDRIDADAFLRYCEERISWLSL